MEPEDSWDYNETEPNLVDILEALKLIRSIDNKEQYKDVLLHIKKQVLEKLCENNLEITNESAIYKLIEIIFTDSLSNSEAKIKLMNFNIVTILLSMDLFYRQLDRYNKTKKKYGDDNRNWNIDVLQIPSITNIVNSDQNLNFIKEEIMMLYSNIQKRRNKI